MSLGLQEILRRSASLMSEDDFLRKLWGQRTDEAGTLPGSLIRIICTKIDSRISEHFGKLIQDILVEAKFASKSTDGPGSAPGWKLNPAKFVKSEPQEEAPAEEQPLLDLSARLAAAQEARKQELDRIADEMSDLEAARGIVDTYGDNPERLGRILAVIKRML